jgi:hypothetical protein
MKEAAEAEKNRAAIIDGLAAGLSLSPDECYLSVVATHAPEPWASRLGYLQKGLQSTLNEARTIIKANAATMRTAQRIVNQSLRSLEQCFVAETLGYDAAGVEATVPRPARLVDQKG